jgi:hypothetical protein
MGSPLVVVGAIIAYLKIRAKLRDWLSIAMQATAVTGDMAPVTMRTQFMDLSLTTKKPALNHTHGYGAADRSMAVQFAQRFCDLTGFTPYSVQRSSADERHGIAGSRAYYWSKDMHIAQQSYVLPQNPCKLMVDVDMYIDMPTTLAEEFVPHLIYTCQPTQVAKTAPEYAYTFNAQNELVYRVTGGGEYRHQVWNYSTDSLLVLKKWWFLPIKAAAYSVDRRRTSDDHELILLTPVCQWRGIWTLLALALRGKTLGRIEPVRGDFLRMETVSPAGAMRSTGRVDTYIQATIPVAKDDTIASLRRTGKLDITIPQVQQFTEGDKTAAAILVEYHRTQTPQACPVVYPLSAALQNYQFEPAEYDPEAKKSLLPFMAPIMNDCYTPDQTPANERDAVKRRVTDVASNAQVTPFMATCMRDFAAAFLPEEHQMDPTDDEEVYARQGKPSQRQILARAEVEAPVRNIQSFLKKEAYGGVKPGRLISQYCPADKLAYSKYIYPLAEHIKTMPWYAFGKSPREIADRVSEICSSAQTVTNSDLSKFDGRVSPAAREFEKIVMTRAYRVKYHAELAELHRSQYCLSAFGRLGTQYETGFSRGSGSPETAVMNSLVNAFIAYFALRMAGYSHEQAWKALGIYGGDDGLTADMFSQVYEKAARAIGQKLTSEVVQRGHLGVSFLARKYGPGVWYEDNSSCCDIPRQLAKFHVTVALNPKVTPLMKLKEKVRAFLLTDENTPIIGLLCKTVVRVVDEELEHDELCAEMQPWLSHLPKDVHYPNDNVGDWMTTYVQQALPSFDHKLFETTLSKISDPHEFLTLPCCVPPTKPKTDVPAVVGGAVVLPEGKTEAKVAKAKNAASKRVMPKSLLSQTVSAVHKRSANPKVGARSAGPWRRS